MILMTTFHLKLIAVITMVVDHIGVFFFPHVLFLRIIGRLSMPLFAWLIANGAHHTRDMRSYLTRLVSFGVLSQIPFMLINRQMNPQFYRLNILFGLTLGLATILLIHRTKSMFVRTGILVLIVWLAYIMNLDYGPVAVLMVIISYYNYKNMSRMFALNALVIVGYYTLPIVGELLRNPYAAVNAVQLFQPVCLLSYIPVALYNGKEGPKTGYFF